MLLLLLNLICALLFAHGQPDQTMVRMVYPFGSPFDEILVNGPFDVSLNQISEDNGTRIEIEAPNHLHQQIVSEIIDNHTLSVYTVGSFHSHRNILVRIVFKAPLLRYGIKGTGNTITENDGITNKDGEKFVLANHGTANVAMQLDVYELNALLTGTGNTRLWGKVREKSTISSKGVGDVNAVNLTSKRVVVQASGVGNVGVSGIEDAQIKVTGVSTVYYRLPDGKVPSVALTTGLGEILSLP